MDSLPTELSGDPTLQIDFFQKQRRKEGREGGKREKAEGRAREWWGERKSPYSERCSGLGTAYLLAHLYILFHCGRRGYCWGRVSALTLLDSVTTVLITVFCQLWCWNPAETADVPEADGQRPSGPPQ